MQTHTIQSVIAPLRELPTPSVVMLIGIPGSGKSYIGTLLSGLLQLPVLSSDNIREELTGNAGDQTVNKKAWALLHERTQEYVANGQSVIIDATQAKLRTRRDEIALYKSFEAHLVVGVYVRCDLATAVQRNNTRSRIVPDAAIASMYHNLKFNPPSLEDGFDALYAVDN